MAPLSEFGDRAPAAGKPGRKSVEAPASGVGQSARPADQHLRRRAFVAASGAAAATILGGGGANAQPSPRPVGLKGLWGDQGDGRFVNPILPADYSGDWSGRACLPPVRWIDGWPVLGEPGVDGIGNMVWSSPKPIAGRDRRTVPRLSDDFSSGALGPQWEWNHAPRPDMWSLTAKPGASRT